MRSFPASRRPGRRTAWCSRAATRARSPPSPRAAPASRTRGRSWSRWRWPPRRSRARTGRWLDLCAGPGGKAALLAALAARRGARLVAGERQPHRARLVARSLEGADGVLGVVAADGTAPPWPAGTLRPGPGRRARAPGWARCAAVRRRAGGARPTTCWRWCLLQRALVGSALELVRPGGVVLYATCSPVLAETEGVVTSVLQTHPEATLEDATTLLPGVPNCAGPTPGHRAALAAPARHRRDVHGAVPQVLTAQSSRTWRR